MSSTATRIIIGDPEVMHTHGDAILQYCRDAGLNTSALLLHSKTGAVLIADSQVIDEAACENHTDPGEMFRSIVNQRRWTVRELLLEDENHSE